MTEVESFLFLWMSNLLDKSSLLYKHQCYVNNKHTPGIAAYQLKCEINKLGEITQKPFLSTISVSQGNFDNAFSTMLKLFEI